MRFFALLALILTATLVRADEAEYAAAEALMGGSGSVIRLDDQTQNRIQSYFDGLNRQMDFQDEAGAVPPRVILVIPKKESLAFVFPKSPGFVFWDVRFFLENKTADLDKYVMAHERGHFSATNQAMTDTRSKEYETDMRAIGTRLFRLGQRDPVTGDPQAAIAHVETLIEFFSNGGGYREDYANGASIAAGTRVLYAQERTRRHFPEAAEPRPEWPEVLNAVKAALEANPYKNGFVQAPEAPSQTLMHIQSITQRIDGQLIEALKTLERRRVEGRNSVPMNDWKLMAEFVATVEKLKEKLEKRSIPDPVQAFESFAVLPPKLFADWNPVNVYRTLADAGLHAYWLQYEAPILEMANVDVPSILTTDKLPGFGMLMTVMGTSRLFRYMTDHPEMYQDKFTPLTVFWLKALLAQAEKDLGFSTHVPPRLQTIQKFLDMYGGRLKINAGDERAIGNELIAFADSGTETVRWNLYRVFSELDFRQTIPGLNDYLVQNLPANDKFAVLRFAAGSDSKSPADFMRRLLSEGKHDEFLQLLISIYKLRNQIKTKINFDEFWSLFLNQAPVEPNFLATLEDSLMYFTDLKVTQSSKPEHAARILRDAQDARYSALRDSLTRRVRKNSRAFFQDWSKEYPSHYSALAALVRWDQVFEDFQSADFEMLAKSRQFKHESAVYAGMQIAAANRMTELLTAKESITPSELDTAIRLLAIMPSTSEGSQKLTAYILGRIENDGSYDSAETAIFFLNSIKFSQIQDMGRFVDLYVKSIVNLYTRDGKPFTQLNLRQLQSSLEQIRRLEPQIATAILNRLAEEYHAGLDLKAFFSYSYGGRQNEAATLVTDLHIWNEVFRELKPEYVLNLIGALRGTENLAENLKLELEIRLAQTGVLVRSSEVEDYVRNRFTALAPMHRAGMIQLLLEGTSNLLDSADFRRDIFKRILDRLPDAKTRSVFLDIWEAGMEALPVTLRSVVLSVVLSESGKTGSPEKALVTLLANMGPLELKFGQALAFANIPESYRQELRTIWDGAQQIGWWQAWELLLVQKGDIRQAGYTLSRILHSGSTEVFLEIEHQQTGRKFVVPVFRDGVQRAVSVGAEQLRRFAGFLAKRNPALYGFLPVIVEDSIHTMKFELDPGHKRRMTERMDQAYREAGKRLGFTVDSNGNIHGHETGYAHLPFVEIKLTDGKVIVAQELADGVPLRELEHSDPQRYRAITAELLALEAEVQKDSSAPVDKDRMPGQNIVSRAKNLNYILDHGQAMFLDADVHAAFIEFTRKGFAGDVKWMAETLTAVSGMAVPITPTLVAQVGQSDSSLKPLIFMNAVSRPFLNLPDSDPRRKKFFQLLHGVRAQIRLLQWDQSESDGELGRQARMDVLNNLGTVRSVGLWLAGGWQRLRNFVGQIGAAKSTGEQRMDEAYLKAQGQCDHALRGL